MTHRVSLSIFLAALALLLLSSHDTSASRRRNYPLRVPDEIAHTLGVLRMQDLDSQRVSVTFWSTDDAVSRMENIWEALRAKNDPTLTHIGVNVDANPGLAAAYLQRDNLDGDSLQVFALPGSGLREEYGLRTIFR